MVFQKNFELKIILGKFYIIFTKPILDISSHFKIGVSLAIHSTHEDLVDKMHALDFRLAIIYLQNDRDSFLISLFATNFN